MDKKNLKITTSDIHEGCCYFCFDIDYEQKEYFKRLPFHPNCLKLAKTQEKTKMKLIFELIDIWKLYGDILFLKNLFEIYLVNSISSYKIIFTNEKSFNIYTVTDTQFQNIYFLSKEMKEFGMDYDIEETVILKKRDFIIFNSLL
jgi:hypothetical protein